MLGTAADPEHLIVCTGFRQGLALTCRWLAASGIARVALDDAGWHAQRLIVEEAGLQVTPIAVDQHGIDVAALSRSGADAVVVTPAHQFPNGAALADHLPSWRPMESGGGLYVTTVLPGHIDEPALLAAAARRGVGIEGLSLHSYTGDCAPGVVLGHGYMAEPAIERGIALLSEAAGSL